MKRSKGIVLDESNGDKFKRYKIIRIFEDGSIDSILEVDEIEIFIDIDGVNF